MLSSPLSFQERTHVPFITYVTSLFHVDGEVKSTQKHSVVLPSYNYHIGRQLNAKATWCAFRAVFIF